MCEERAQLKKQWHLLSSVHILHSAWKSKNFRSFALALASARRLHIMGIFLPILAIS